LSGKPTLILRADIARLAKNFSAVVVSMKAVALARL